MRQVSRGPYGNQANAVFNRKLFKQGCNISYILDFNCRCKNCDSVARQRHAVMLKMIYMDQINKNYTQNEPEKQRGYVLDNASLFEKNAYKKEEDSAGILRKLLKSRRVASLEFSRISDDFTKSAENQGSTCGEAKVSFRIVSEWLYNLNEYVDLLLEGAKYLKMSSLLFFEGSNSAYGLSQDDMQLYMEHSFSLAFSSSIHYLEALWGSKEMESLFKVTSAGDITCCEVAGLSASFGRKLSNMEEFALAALEEADFAERVLASCRFNGDGEKEFLSGQVLQLKSLCRKQINELRHIGRQTG